MLQQLSNSRHCTVLFSQRCQPGARTRRQRGVTLLELLVGIAVGLLVVAVATGALMVSRGISGTVSDASGIQQQAAYVMRVIGGQLRPAGSLYLNPNPKNASDSELLTAPVGLEKRAEDSSAPNFEVFDVSKLGEWLAGDSSSVTVGFQRYADPVFTSATNRTLTLNCQGGPTDGLPLNTDQLVQSVFKLDGSELKCSGNKGSQQALARNVANFRVRYLQQQAGSTGNPTVQYVQADDIDGDSGWRSVQAVEVCLVLYGDEPIDMPAGSSYLDCDGSTSVDMTSLTGSRAKRMHMVFRNVFQLRSQGVL